MSVDSGYKVRNASLSNPLMAFQCPLKSSLANIVTMTTIVKVYMKLHIRNITKDDFMEYRCVARNSLGDSDGSITLYGSWKKTFQTLLGIIFCAEVSRPTPSTTTVVTTIGPETTTQRRQRMRGLLEMTTSNDETQQ